MSPILIPGQTLELAYPAHNRFAPWLEFVDRRIEIEAVQDFSRGLPIKHFLRRPLVRRGRLLVIGIDTDTGSRRKFWFESRKDARLLEYRLGLYDPNHPGELVDWVDRLYGPTQFEILRMRKTALRWLQLVRDRGDIGLRLAAYPWEA